MELCSPPLFLHFPSCHPPGLWFFLHRCPCKASSELAGNWEAPFPPPFPCCFAGRGWEGPEALSAFWGLGGALVSPWSAWLGLGAVELGREDIPEEKALPQPQGGLEHAPASRNLQLGQGHGLALLPSAHPTHPGAFSCMEPPRKDNGWGKEDPELLCKDGSVTSPGRAKLHQI